MKKPSKSILDRSFVYVPSTATSVDQTWRRFGWRPNAEAAAAAPASSRATPGAVSATVQ